MAVDVCLLEVFEQQTFEKGFLCPHLKHSASFAGHFGQGWYGLLQFQHVCAAGSNSRLAVIETTDV